MDDLERRLQLAVVMYVGGARLRVSCVDAAIAISKQLDIPRHHFSVHKFHPEDFLVVFASHEVRNKALGVPFVEHQGFKLFVKPWLRQAQAKSKLMRVQVDLMIEGVPSHAWSRETATELLGSSCLIESLAPETANREDLSLFKLHAWCIDSDEVPARRMLWVPEPSETVVNPAALLPSFRQLLEYPTLIHIGRVRDHTPPERWRRSPSSDGGSGQSGLLDSSNGSVQGEWSVLPWTRGVCDARGVGRSTPNFAGGAGQGRSYRQVLEGRVGPSDWRIPPMGPGVTATAALGATGLVHRQSTLAGARSNQWVVENPWEGDLVTASELVTLVQSDRGAEDREIPDKVATISRHTTLPSGVEQILPIENRHVSLPPVVELLQPMEQSGTAGIVANDDVRILASPVAERVQQIELQGTASPQTEDDRDQVSTVELGPMGTDPGEVVGEVAHVGQPSQPRFPREPGPGQGRCLAEGWAPVEELLAPNDSV
ncbi:hypothetical protein CFC21_058528 [Triticum aestivum]|uniref:DUF4283 domain-containing protein n=2 Tax=Triticum aestivum TaxID=4565 RepID=A0A9R1KDJ2_WHEAT|nr:uncharacterized protein LOC123095097 [Triticum aestivum]KAF7050122.1 hypothetical protein CFC21_058528 [Triticum aestivum]